MGYCLEWPKEGEVQSWVPNPAGESDWSVAEIEAVRGPYVKFLATPFEVSGAKSEMLCLGLADIPKLRWYMLLNPEYATAQDCT